MGRPLWQNKVITLLWPRRRAVALLTRLPFVGLAIKRFFFKGDYMAYIPSTKAYREKIKVVLPDAVVNYFIEKASFRFLMHQCMCRVAGKCENYPVSVGCLFLGEAARGINPALGREVSVEEAKKMQEQVEKLGLLNLVGRIRLDKIWLGVNPGEKLLTICHCCECCCLWKLLPHFSGHISSMLYKLDGVEVSVNGPCRGCGMCAGACFAGAITIREGRAIIGEGCRGCGRCVAECPEGAITLVLSGDDFIEECIDRISSHVSV